MRLTIAIALILLAMGSAFSQKFTGNTVFMAVQCDIGRFAATAKQTGLDPAMKAGIDFSWKVETSTKVQSSFSLKVIADWIFKGPSVRAASEWTKTDENSMRGTFIEAQYWLREFRCLKNFGNGPQERGECHFVRMVTVTQQR